MIPYFMSDSGSKSLVRLQGLLHNLSDCAQPGMPVCLSTSVYETAQWLLGQWPTGDDEHADKPSGNYWEWWCSKITNLCNAHNWNDYKMVFCWLADALTGQEDCALAALQRAEMALVAVAAKHETPEGLEAWVVQFQRGRERRGMFRDAVLIEWDRESSVSSPRDGSFKALSRERIDPTLLMRPRTPAPVNRRQPKPAPPPPPPPPPDPVLPDDLPTAGRTRLVEVLSHPTNLGLLGLEPKDLSPTMTLSRLRSLVNTLRQGAP